MLLIKEINFTQLKIFGLENNKGTTEVKLTQTKLKVVSKKNYYKNKSQ
jgi:hypothetical protein